MALTILVSFRFNDIDKATKSKSSLEHCQREEARLRKEANEEWETKVIKLSMKIEILDITSLTLIESIIIFCCISQFKITVTGATRQAGS